MDNKINLIPLNRHVVIDPHLEKNETSSGVLLPEDFSPDLDKYITARVLHVSQDCKDTLKEACWFHDRKEISVVVDRAMVEEIKVFGTAHHVVLENYILGVLNLESPTAEVG